MNFVKKTKNKMNKKHPRDSKGWLIMGLPNDLKDCEHQLRLTKIFGPRDNEKPLEKQIKKLKQEKTK